MAKLPVKKTIVKESSKAKSTGKPKVDSAPPACAVVPADFCLRDFMKESSWLKGMGKEFEKEYCKKLEKSLKKESHVFPPLDLVFNAFNRTPLHELKVVIIGQDPYHDDGQAHGFCFSVPNGVKPPPSLKNMYKELTTDIPGFKAPDHGNLEKWADQGVLLLNATLTVRPHQANSHKDFGWQTFTDAAISHISKECEKVVFILWGKFAQKKCKMVDRKKHHVIEAAHPSPLSAKAFFGCKVFSQTNSYLRSVGKDEIDWQL